MIVQVIKLWDLETGSEIFEYGEAHDDSAVTCLTLDNSQRRFVLNSVVTPAYDAVVLAFHRCFSIHPLPAFSNGIFTLNN